jgi:hypothetical protein
MHRERGPSQAAMMDFLILEEMYQCRSHNAKIVDGTAAYSTDQVH